MNKVQFLLALNDKLSSLPLDEVEERVNFYSEMIEDRMEEGFSEADAVAAVGSVDEIAAQITEEIPLIKIVKERIKPRRKRKTWEITLLALGSPVWVPLLIAAVAVVFSLYVSLWSVIVSLWAVFASLAVCALAVAILGIVVTISGNVHVGVATVAAGLVCAGLSIFSFLGCKVISKGMLIFTKKMVSVTKRSFAKKEDTK